MAETPDFEQIAHVAIARWGRDDDSSPFPPMEGFDDLEIAIGGRGGVLAADELVVQSLEQLGHRHLL